MEGSRTRARFYKRQDKTGKTRQDKARQDETGNKTRQAKTGKNHRDKARTRTRGKAKLQKVRKREKEKKRENMNLFELLNRATGNPVIYKLTSVLVANLEYHLRSTTTFTFLLLAY